MLVADESQNRPQPEGEEIPSPQPAAENSAPAEQPPANLHEAPPESLDGPLSLEQRVRRLEDVIAALHLAPPGWLDAVRQPAEDRSGIVTEPASSAPPTDGFLPASEMLPGNTPFQPRKQGWLFF